LSTVKSQENADHLLVIIKSINPKPNNACKNHDYGKNSGNDTRRFASKPVNPAVNFFQTISGSADIAKQPIGVRDCRY
jgi:adenine C2-methylase RlmN of 23S rRNA A2503 and tRNA A37